MILKDCSRCLIYTPKGQRFSEARVVHTKKSVSLFFSDYKMQDARFRSRVDFFDIMAGLIVTECEIVIRRNPAFLDTGEPWTADCQILDVKKIVQRQRDIRARVCLEIAFRKKNDMQFYGTVQNISAGGMYFTTIQHLYKGETISFSYSFRTLERPFKAVVLWGKKAENGRFGYGCKLVGLTDGAESAIRSFVYKKLLERGDKEA